MASTGKMLFWGALGAAAGLALASQRRRGPSFVGQSVVITGGSRGFGLALARAFGREGARITILARSRDELDRAESHLRDLGVDAQSDVCDVRQEPDVRRAIAAILARRGRIDVLINNAGVITVGPERHMSLEDYRNSLAVHVEGPLYAMQHVIPHMRRNGGGRIVNISSIGGIIAMPHLAPYTVGKFALRGLSLAMRHELKKEGIYVTTVCPGLMRTGSHVRALFRGRHDEEFTWFSFGPSLPVGSIDADRAARQVVEACRRGRAQLVYTPPAVLASAAASLWPAGVSAVLEAVDRHLLPRATGASGNITRPGEQCRSRLAPSRLTRLADRAVRPNNEGPDRIRWKA